MARVNYQREKRLKDLDRQRKQEEKRRRKLEKGQAGAGSDLPDTDLEGGAEAGDEGADLEAAPDVQAD